MALLLAAAASAAFFFVQSFERELGPEIDKKAQVVGRALARQIARAVEHGIPFEGLYGMEAFIADVLRDNDDITTVDVVDPAGRAVYAFHRESGDAAS